MPKSPEVFLPQKQLICQILVFTPITSAHRIEKCLPLFHRTYLHPDNVRSLRDRSKPYQYLTSEVAKIRPNLLANHEHNLC
ncbi:MAG TPA: hypothetical protein V6D14_30310 [Coleofasciculaceae cyanobacterium]